MNRYLLMGVALWVLFAGRLEAQELPHAMRDEGPHESLIFPAGEVEWQPGPASLEPGAEFAILEGDPGEAGFFTMRIRMPNGYVINPHWHPAVERLTVISGTFHLGHGEVLDRESAQPLSPGSYFSMPPGMRHYAIAEGETVVQLSSIGPWEIHYVDPADDPRLRRDSPSGQD